MTHIQAAVPPAVALSLAPREGARPGKRLLQVAVVIAAMLPVAAGAWGVFTAPVDAALSSHARYLSGLLFAIGLGFWSTVPRIEHRSERFRVLTGLVMIGGLCRLGGVVAGDVLSVSTAAALAMELIVTPVLCYWQGRTARTARSRDAER